MRSAHGDGGSGGVIEFVTSGRAEKGKLALRNREALDAWAKKLGTGEIIVTFEKAHATRSVDQNALYWAGYIKPLCDHTGYTAMEMHAYCKGRFLPKRHLLIQDTRGQVVEETDIDSITTTRLNKVEFGDYLREIEAFALGLGVTVGSNREAA